MSCLLCAGGFNLPVTAQDKPATPSPDVVVFKNGDRLTGTVMRGVNDTIIFKSDVVGEVTVPMDKVKELRSNGSFVVFKKNEQITRTPKKPGNITVSDETITVVPPSGAPESVPVKDLAFVVDKPTYNKEVAGNPGIWFGWKGSVGGGVTIVQSTSTGRTYTANIALVRFIPTATYLPPRTRTTFNLTEVYGKLTTPVIPQTTPPSPDDIAKVHIFDTNLERNKYFTPHMYALYGLSYGHNYSEGLNFRQIYGVGLGWTVIRDSVQLLDLSADVHYERQNFHPPTPNENLIGSTFAETYRRTLPYNILFTQIGTYTQAWNDLHAYSAIGAVGLAMPVYKRFSLSLNIRNDYLNNPAFGYKKNSFEFLTEITYRLP
ncbi:MAG TPA: DUF481 domain-containing protein [Edaphobacter sp.]